MAFHSGWRGFFNSLGLFALRVGFGTSLMFGHGLNKLLNFTEIAPKFSDPFGVGGKISLGLAVFAEVFCSAAVILGLRTRISAVPILVTMGVALVFVHGHDPYSKQEPALMYAIPMLTLIFCGGGRYALDSFFGKKDY